MPKVYETSSFERELSSLDKDIQSQVEKIKDELSNTLNVGKPIRYPFLREKKIKGIRVYFLVNKELDSVLLIAISDKKTQDPTIDKIIELLPQFKELMKELT